MVYRRDNPTYDATAIFGPKTSVAPIRNPWEITFGLPGGSTGGGLETVSLQFNNGGGSAGATVAGNAGSTSGRRWSGGWSWHWPGGVDNPWRTPEPPWGPLGRGYFDSHYYDPNTGASVSTRHRYKRAAAEMAQAMASTAPQDGFGPGAPEMTVSMPRQASMLAAQV